MPASLTKLWHDLYGSSSSTDVDLSKQGSTSGALIYALIVRNGSSTDPSTVPTGFELVAKHSTYRPYSWLYRKVGSVSEPTTWTWSWGAADECGGISVAYSGDFYKNQPEEDYSNDGYNTDDTILRGGSVTTTKKETTLLKFGSVGRSTSMSVSSPATNPGTWTSDVNQHNTDSDLLMYAGRYWWSSSKGATGNIDSTLSVADVDKHAFIVAVQQPAYVALLHGFGL